MKKKLQAAAFWLVLILAATAEGLCNQLCKAI